MRIENIHYKQQRMIKYKVEKTYIFMCPSEIVIYVFSTMTITNFRHATPQKVSILIERVRSIFLLQILCTISSSDVVSVERRHRSFAEIPMSWFASSSNAITP